VAAVVVGLLAVAVFLIVLAISGGDSDPGAGASPAASAAASLAQEPAATPTPTPTPVLSSRPSPRSSGGPAEAAAAIEYEVQEGEDLQDIARTFGVSRAAIMALNEGMVDRKPRTSPGDRIIVPISPEMAPEAVEALPGFVDYAETPAG
jgi:hypothetical protein